jgi:hypothetical protein
VTWISTTDTLLLLAGGVGSQTLQGIALVQLGAGSALPVKQSALLALGGPVVDMDVLAASPWGNGTVALHPHTSTHRERDASSLCTYASSSWHRLPYSCMVHPSPLVHSLTRFLSLSLMAGALEPTAVFALQQGGGLSAHELKPGQGCGCPHSPSFSPLTSEDRALTFFSLSLSVGVLSVCLRLSVWAVGWWCGP